MKISSRTKKIINILLNKDDYMTINSIASRVGVSSRTITRNLAEVENWLAENNYNLEKKKGTGIRLKISLQEKINVNKLLEGENINRHYLPEERKLIILTELLSSQIPAKLYTFTRLTNVSETTIAHDLDELEKWLKNYKLEIIRKPGLGVYLAGKERNIRKASIELLYENFALEDILKIIQDRYLSQNRALIRKNIAKEKLLNLIGLDTINLLDTFIKELEDKLTYKLADDAYAALMVHLAIALKRIKDGDQITIDSRLLIEIKSSREFTLAAELGAAIAAQSSLEIPEAEIAYITMHLMGSKGRGSIYNDEISLLDDYRLVYLTRKMIETAELELGVYLEDDEELLIGLVRHLEPSIKRIKLKLEIRNPLLEDIKLKYQALFNAAQKCAAILAREENIDVPESEAAYIAMHLGSAVERKRQPQQKFRAAVACTSGIGASRLLASRLSKEFKNIEISSLISALTFDNKLVEDLKLDLIVSTVDIPQSKVPVIVVSPFLTEIQQQKINDFLSSHQARQISPRNKITLAEKLEIINKYNQGILEILNNFMIYNDYQFSNLAELINDAAYFLTTEIESISQLAKDLQLREEKGSTVLKKNKIMLLHCQSKAISELKIAIIKPQYKFELKNKQGEKNEIEVVILMAAPLKGSIQGREVLSEISRLLIENSNFIAAVKNTDQEKIYAELAVHFDYFLQQKSMVNYYKEENR